MKNDTNSNVKISWRHNIIYIIFKLTTIKNNNNKQTNLEKVLDSVFQKTEQLLFKLAIGLFLFFVSLLHKYCWLHDVMAIEQWHYLPLDYFPVDLALTIQFCLPQSSNVPGKWKLTGVPVRLKSISICIHVSIIRLNEGINTLLLLVVLWLDLCHR